MTFEETRQGFSEGKKRPFTLSHPGALSDKWQRPRMISSESQINASHKFKLSGRMRARLRQTVKLASWPAVVSSKLSQMDDYSPAPTNSRAATKGQTQGIKGQVFKLKLHSWHEMWENRGMLSLHICVCVRLCACLCVPPCLPSTMCTQPWLSWVRWRNGTQGRRKPQRTFKQHFIWSFNLNSLQRQS